MFSELAKKCLSSPVKTTIAFLCVLAAVVAGTSTAVLYTAHATNGKTSRAGKTRTIYYSAPLTIREGGTYSGNWASTNPSIPAVTIATDQPVIILNSYVKGPGNLIQAQTGHTNLIVRNTVGYGLNPNIAGRAKGSFVLVDSVAKLIVEHCDIENTDFGISVVNGYSGNRKGDQTIIVRYNRGKNMDGRYSDGHGGYMTSMNARTWSHFIQLEQVTGVPGIELAWNQVVDEPFQSSVDDVINIYQSSGTPQSPMHIHDNYIQGAYSNNPKLDSYSGGGIITDGNIDTKSNATAYVKIYNNQVISTTNYGIAFSNGHDNAAYNNRIISCGCLADGSSIVGQNVGAYVVDTYNGNLANGTFYNDHMYNNVIAWVNNKEGWNHNRNDMYFSVTGSDYGRNTALPNPISYKTEKAELILWLKHIKNAHITPGSSLSLPSEMGNML